VRCIIDTADLVGIDYSSYDIVILDYRVGEHTNTARFLRYIRDYTYKRVLLLTAFPDDLEDEFKEHQQIGVLRKRDYQSLNPKKQGSKLLDDIERHRKARYRFAASDIIKLMRVVGVKR
jgi:hypothetical protein